MEGSFLEYAYSVIYSRALPDARDGLKPVQRRILYMMSEMGLRPDRGHVKSARVVGEVMGKLHPHGDTAIYDAMVRMAQDFSLRLPLIDGHGNFGSLDDGPAAPRYTEARLAAAALTLTDHLDEDVVDFVPNYDNQLTQPDVLPAAFPNLLVNGATGIAVGMATNMAPHNLVEVIAAARHLIEHPDATLEDIMKFVPGPDLPTGGRIVGLDGIRDAYATGRGSFKTRAKVEVEQLSARRTGLVVTELPYMVGPEKVIEKIKDAVNGKKLTGISDIVDLTDRKHGLRLVIELKNGFNPNAVLQQLYRYSPMEDSFGINNVTLVDGQPQTLGLLQLLSVYVDHRINVVRRRTAFRLGKKKDRLHLVEGLLIAIVDIDEVIQIIRSSDEAAAARTRLMSIYDLSEIQANYILELRLRQLTKYSRIELEKEQDELRREIAELEAILGSSERLRGLVSAELAEIAEKYGTPRRTVLLESEAVSPTVAALAAAPGAKGKAAPLALEIADDPCWAILTASGQIARTANQDSLAESGPRTRHDVFTSVVKTSARGEIAAVTSQGRMLRLQVMDMPVLPPTSGHAEPGRRRAGQGLHHAPQGRIAGGLRAAGRGPGDRHRAGRGQARPARLPAEPRGLGSHRAQGQGHRGGRGPRRVRRRRPRLRDAAVPAAALHRLRRPSAGPDRRRHGRHQAGRRGPGAVLRRRQPGRRRRRRRHHRRHRRGAAGHRAGRRQGHRTRRVPCQGPRHGRGPGAPFPQGRGHPAARAGPATAPPRRPRWPGWPGPFPGEHGRRDGSGIPLSQAVDAIGPSMAWPAARGRSLGSRVRGHLPWTGAPRLCRNTPRLLACLSSRIPRTGPGSCSGPALSAVSMPPRRPRRRCPGIVTSMLPRWRAALRRPDVAERPGRDHVVRPRVRLPRP